MKSKIIDFLIKAKKETYAGKGPETEASRPRSHDLKYEEENLLYIDTYLGGQEFAGEEAIWENGIPFWAMNYCGRVINVGFDGNLLKEALLQVSSHMPYRGPSEYKRDDFLYQCTVDGDFEWFSGREEIFKSDVKVYECVFHGGTIQ